MILPPFKYHQPTCLKDALALARSCAGDFDFIAGGTDVLPNYKNRLNHRNNVISLSGVQELYDISAEKIGGMTTLVQLENSDVLQARLPVLPAAARLIATPLLRETATVGGNILLDNRCWFFNQSPLWRESKGFCMKADGDVCLVVPQKEVCYATYSGDLAPVFMALDATLHLAGPEGSRELPVAKFFRHDGIARNVKLPEEILTYISIPKAALGMKTAYRKLRIRDSMDYPVMGAAAALAVNNGTITTLRIAITGMETTPVLYNEITQTFVGELLSDKVIGQICSAVQQEVNAYRNVHFSPQYRKAMVGVYLKRILTELSSRNI